MPGPHRGNQAPTETSASRALRVALPKSWLAPCRAYRLISMPRVRLPEIADDLAIVVTRAGTPAVTNGRTGKNKIFIPCRDHEHAKDVVRKIREAKPGAEVLL